MALRMVQGYRPEQLSSRVLLMLRRRLPRDLGTDQRPPPFHEETLRAVADHSRSRFSDPEHAALLAEGRICLLGREETVRQEGFWAAGTSQRSRLWEFTLHHHEFLVPAFSAGGAARRRALELLDAWLRECPPTGSALWLAWHPYVMSSRVVPWAAVLADAAPPALAQAMSASLWRQLRVIAGHLERDVGGNHIIRNAKALAVGGALFQGPAADALRRRGQRLLAALLADQLGLDGAHAEGSPTYQALVIEDALDAIASARPEDDLGLLRSLAGRALGWLVVISPPGLPRPHLNDSSEGHAESTGALLDRARLVGVAPHRSLAPPRYPRYRVFEGDGARLLFDAAPPSRPDLPYHAHADSLAISLELDGVPVIVDRAVASYERGPARAWARSTAAHSTVQIDRQDSSEVIGAFRAGRLARTTVSIDEPDRMVASHDGAGRSRLKHARSVERIGSRRWRVTDTTSHASYFLSHLHLAPQSIITRAKGEVTVVAGTTRMIIRLFDTESVDVVATTHALGLGRTTTAPTLRVRSSRARSTFTIHAS